MGKLYFNRFVQKNYSAVSDDPDTVHVPRSIILPLSSFQKNKQTNKAWAHNHHWSSQTYEFRDLQANFDNMVHTTL